jgi:tRNA threonylcarbamoyladenosine biosynthesis protein TsaB
MYEPAIKSLRERRFEDIAYFEPFYLKDFITSRPKKNILGR